MSSKNFKKYIFLLVVGLAIGGAWSGQVYGSGLDQEAGGDLVVPAFLSGYQDGSFRPNKVISREETAAIFYRLYGEPAAEMPNIKFSDIGEDRWSRDPIYSLSSKGLINGYNDRTFRPTEPINRGEAAAIMCKFAGLEPGEAETTNMTDLDGHWAREYIIMAIEKGWLSGSNDGYFRPGDHMTRADVASMINSYLSKKYEYVSSTETVDGFIDLSPYTFYYHDVLRSVNDSTYRTK